MKTKPRPYGGELFSSEQLTSDKLKSLIGQELSELTSQMNAALKAGGEWPDDLNAVLTVLIRANIDDHDSIRERYLIPEDRTKADPDREQKQEAEKFESENGRIASFLAALTSATRTRDDLRRLNVAELVDGSKSFNDREFIEFCIAMRINTDQIKVDIDHYREIRAVVPIETEIEDSVRILGELEPGLEDAKRKAAAAKLTFDGLSRVGFAEQLARGANEIQELRDAERDYKIARDELSCIQNKATALQRKIDLLRASLEAKRLPVDPSSRLESPRNFLVGK